MCSLKVHLLVQIGLAQHHALLAGGVGFRAAHLMHSVANYSTADEFLQAVHQYHDALLASPQSMARVACEMLPDGMQVANDTIIMLIGLVYCVIQPIIAPLAMLYFLIGMLIWKYQVVYVYVPLVESGGKVSLHLRLNAFSHCFLTAFSCSVQLVMLQCSCSQ